jgi:endoglucanase
MKLHRSLLLACGIPALLAAGPGSSDLRLGAQGYLTKPGLDVFVFTDIYPDGHQTGVTIIQHGVRVAANGDLRLEPAPGQWSPMPASGERQVDAATGTVTQKLRYPDPTKNAKGFNPIFYPDLDLGYSVHVTPAGGNSFRIRVDLDKPLPAEWVGKVGFNLELFPTDLFGKSWLMDGEGGVFPRQPNGPVERLRGPRVPEPRHRQPNGPVDSLNGQPLAAPLATGRTLVVAAEEEKQRLTITSRTGQIELIDGRLPHNNGWFIVRSKAAAGATRSAVEWVVTPNVVPDWRYEPVIQVSQVGYAPAQPKRAVIELDAFAATPEAATLYRLGANGREKVVVATPTPWGNFLRYRYATFDFSQVREPGMYVVDYAGKTSHPFRIAADVYARHVWQPTLEYFLPVQMCHMLVRQKYRIWHGIDHLDDALMAPVGLNHNDGYLQGPSTLTRFKPGEIVPGLNAGGWHDAGDYDLRVESQIGTVWLLARMVEEFGLDYDATRIDQQRKLVEIHDPDGKNDALQQIEHGLLSVLGGYRALGRLYRGIIDPSLRQYVMLGDGSLQTDNVFKREVDDLGLDNSGNPIRWDDRWVFTEDNPDRELYTAAGLAGAGRALRKSNPALAAEAIAAARDLTMKAVERGKGPNRVFALAELVHATGDKTLVARLAALEGEITADIGKTGWMLASILDRLPRGFRENVTRAVATYQAKVAADARTDSPYGIPYVPKIWGAGWDIQERGVQQYFFHKGWPQLTSTESYVNALNFVLGVHPGQNTASFASGVGSHSATVAYGVNRADWSYIPGGVISGTNLVRPDLPELKVWPYFWQQTEYVMGGGETNFMFLALAADTLYRERR